VGKKVKVVFDTNVWTAISMKKILKDEFLRVKENLSVYISKDIALEISRVLQYQRVSEVLRRAGVRERDVLRVIASNSKMVETNMSLHVINEDFEDNKMIECALAAGADILVSGDKHLLSLGKFRKTRILKPREFFDSFPSNSES
jgi:putative PIN family toxin of toxin-antitoxin system